MDSEQLLDQLSQFLLNEKACKESILCLNGKATVIISVENLGSLLVKRKDGQVVVEKGPNYKADFIFKASPKGIHELISESSLSVGALGVKLLKQIIAKEIHFSMHISIVQATSRGYLKIIALGGSEFWGELKKHKITSLPKIISVLKKFRKG